VSSRCQKGLTILDAIVTLCLIGILIGVVIPKYQKVTQAAQEAAIRAELSNIRTGIQLFQILHRRNPASLREMIEKKTLMPARLGTAPPSWSFFEDKYLLKNAVDAGGVKLDAFGNPFFYDPIKGEVRSTTEGYENW
jgi:competence protein ComGC